jgi:hypothetical protein
MRSAIDEMLDRINPRNLERIRVSCEADGDHELLKLIEARLVPASADLSSGDEAALRS